MADYQRVVEFLRDLRQGTLAQVTDEITQAATEYATLCVQANERLRKCSTLLQQGLRTEALHLADDPPNLLDLIAALDLPDPMAWADFCQNNGLPVPPPLQLDRATQLNDAYAQDQPLEHLMAQHRMLALARGPVRERLAVMRRISTLDPSATTWEKDIRIFEKARLKELPAVFYAAVKNKDETAIHSLWNEVTQQPWFEQVPADLSTAVSDAFHRVQRLGVETQLKRLVEPLREAYAAQSVQECRALVKQWRGTMEAAGVTAISAELTDEIRPVIAFVTDQDKKEELLRKFRDSCKAFGRMLDGDVPDAQLEMGYSRLKEFKQPIAPDITERYEAKLAARERDINRKHRGRMIGMAVSAAGVVVVVLVVVVMVTRSNEAKVWAVKINQTLSAHNHDALLAAQEYVDELKKNHPGFLNEASLAQAVRDVSAMQSSYNRDLNSTQDLMAKFADAEKSAAGVVAKPDASLDDLATAVTSLQTVLGQATAAGDLSWADTPDKKYATEINRLQSLLAGARSKETAAARAEIDTMSANADTINLSNNSLAQKADAFGTMAARVRILKDVASLDDDTRNAVATLSQRLDQALEQTGTARSMASELDAVRRNATSSDDLKRVLSSFIQRLPNDPRTNDFTMAVTRMSRAKDVETWHEMAVAWTGQLIPVNAAMAQKRIDTITAYLSSHPESPMTATANSYIDYLHKVSDALDEKSTWQTAMADLFSNPMLADLAYLETSDGQRFYVLGDIKRTDRTLNGQVSVNFEALNPSDVMKRMLVSVDAPAKLMTDKPVPAPHTKVVSEMTEQIKVIDANDWDTWGIDATDSLLKNKQVNPVVQAIIIQQLLKTENTVAEWAIGDTYTRALTELTREKPDQLPWTDLSRIPPVTLKSIQGTLDAIPPAAAVKAKLAAARTSLLKSVSFDIISTAVLLKDDAGNWSVGSRTLATDGVLWIALPANGSPAGASPFAPAIVTPTTSPAPADPSVAASPGQLVQIGTVAAGKFSLFDNVVRDLPQGTIVFITQP